MSGVEIARSFAAAGSGRFVIEPGEHRGGLVIDRPMTVVGRGAISHLQGQRGGGPAVHVRVRGVVLEDFGVEHLDPDGFAILADPGTDPTCTNVVVWGGKCGGVVLRTRAATSPGKPPSGTSPTVRPPPPVRPPEPRSPTTGPVTRAPAGGPATPQRAAARSTAPAPVSRRRQGTGWFVLAGALAVALVAWAIGDWWSRREPAEPGVTTTSRRDAGAVDAPPPPPVVDAPPATPPPPSAAHVEFVGWDPRSRDGVVDVTYADDGGSIVVRGVFDPRNDVVGRLGGPGPRAIYRYAQRDRIAHPGAQAHWSQARPARDYRIDARAGGRGASSPDGAVTIAVDAEWEWTDTRMMPVDVATTDGGFRVTWRRGTPATPTTPPAHSSIRASTRNVVTFLARSGDFVWDLLPLVGRLEDGPPVDVLYQDVDVHWGNDRVVITVNESTGDAGLRRAWYYVRSLGPQIKILYPPGQRARGHAAADLIERRTALRVTTLEENRGVRRGIFYRVRTDPDTGELGPGDAYHRGIAERLQPMLDLPEIKEDPSKGWTDIMIVL